MEEIKIPQNAPRNERGAPYSLNRLLLTKFQRQEAGLYKKLYLAQWTGLMLDDDSWCDEEDLRPNSPEAIAARYALDSSVRKIVAQRTDDISGEREYFINWEGHYKVNRWFRASDIRLEPDFQVQISKVYLRRYTKPLRRQLQGLKIRFDAVDATVQNFIDELKTEYGRSQDATSRTHGTGTGNEGLLQASDGNYRFDRLSRITEQLSNDSSDLINTCVGLLAKISAADSPDVDSPESPRSEEATDTNLHGGNNADRGRPKSQYFSFRLLETDDFSDSDAVESISQDSISDNPYPSIVDWLQRSDEPSTFRAFSSDDVEAGEP